MDELITVIIIAVTALTNVACFAIGAKVGQVAHKGEDIKLPTINPVKAYREREAREEARLAQERIDTIMRNIDTYDGTARGQEDVR